MWPFKSRNYVVIDTGTGKYFSGTPEIWTDKQENALKMTRDDAIGVKYSVVLRTNIAAVAVRL